MIKNIKSKLIFILGSILIIVGIIYHTQTNKNEFKEIDFGNIVIKENDTQEQDIENVVEIEKRYIKIHIAGEVKNTGILELEEGSRISDAIEKAGGTTEMASLDKVNLAYSLEDGQKLYIPNKKEKDTEYITIENGENIVEETKTSSAGKKINLNKADEDNLQEIPGIGPSMAKKIILYRNENGNFKSIEELKNVSGIGDKKFDSMKEDTCVKETNS